MDYITIEMLHAYGGFTGPSNDDDMLLQHFITAASAMVDSYCGRVFGIPTGAVATTRTFTIANGLLQEGEAALYFPDDVYTVTTIPTLTAGVTLTWMPDRPPYYGVIRSSGSWEDPTTIVAFWAYSESPPIVIQQATLRLANWLSHQRESVMSMGETVNGPNLMPADIADTLAPYRRVRLP